MRDRSGRGRGITKGWAPIGNRDALFGPIGAANESALRTKSTVAADDANRHVGNDSNVAAYDRISGRMNCAFSVTWPGDIQSDLSYDYRTNVDAYPKWQAWMREKQPRLLVIWGKYDLSSTSVSRNAIGRTFPSRSARTRRRPLLPGHIQLRMKSPHWCEASYRRSYDASDHDSTESIG